LSFYFLSEGLCCPVSLKKKLFHFFKIIKLAVSEACGAIGLIAVDAEIAILIACNYCFASETFACSTLLVLGDHASLVLRTAGSVLFHALVLRAEAEALLLSSVEDELVCQVLKDVGGAGLEFLKVEVLNALVVGEFCSDIFLVADLAYDLHLRAVPLDVLMKLASGHVLVLLSVADVAAKFGAVELSVGL